MTSQSQLGFRTGTLVFACVLAGLSLWILVSELGRVRGNRLPASAEAAAAAAAARARAAKTTHIGGIRGDLWADYAFTYAAALWSEPKSEPDPGTTGTEARGVIERAVSHAPTNAGVWVLAAALSSRYDWPNSNVAALLKMAYYTGSSDPSLVHLRLYTAAHSDALNDTDIQLLVQRDIRLILTRWQNLRTALPAAYRDANAAAKRFLERAVESVDRSFLPILRGD